MAKLEGMPIPQKAPSLKGLLYISTWRGVAYMASWPKKRKRPLPTIVQGQNEWFRQANVLTKYIDPKLQITAREAVVGTPLYPRDVQVALMKGTLFSIYFDDGSVLHSVATRNAVSESLDVFSKTQGGIIYRNVDQWDVLPPGAVGEVLTSQGPDANPKWSPAGGGGGGAWELVASVDIDGGGILTENGLVLGAYQAMKIVLDGLEVSGEAVNVRLQLEIDDTWVTAGYRYAAQGDADNGATFKSNSASDVGITLSVDGTSWRPNNSDGSIVMSTINVSNPTSADPKATTYETNYSTEPTIVVLCNGGGTLQNTGEITGFRVNLSTGILDAGNMSILGLT